MYNKPHIALLCQGAPETAAQYAPGAYVYKGCGNNRIMAGNSALRVD
jgi:hypothetical protein